MAIFKEMRFVRPSGSTAFDKILRPGAEVAFEGIYQCVDCKLEKAIAGGRSLPKATQANHPEWCDGKGWKLVVATTGASKTQQVAVPALQ